jgi:hypothetical protein
MAKRTSPESCGGVAVAESPAVQELTDPEIQAALDYDAAEPVEAPAVVAAVESTEAPAVQVAGPTLEQAIPQDDMTELQELSRRSGIPYADIFGAFQSGKWFRSYTRVAGQIAIKGDAFCRWVRAENIRYKIPADVIEFYESRKRIGDRGVLALLPSPSPSAAGLPAAIAGAVAKLNQLAANERQDQENDQWAAWTDYRRLLAMGDTATAEDIERLTDLCGYLRIDAQRLAADAAVLRQAEVLRQQLAELPQAHQEMVAARNAIDTYKVEADRRMAELDAEFRRKGHRHRDCHSAKNKLRDLQAAFPQLLAGD